MRQILYLVFLILFVSPSANAQVHSWMKGGDYWVSVDTYREGDKTAKYILTLNNNNRRVEGRNYVSHLMFIEYKCGNPALRNLQNIYTTKPLGQGKIVFRVDSPDSRFEIPVDNSIEASALKLICSNVMKKMNNSSISDDKGLSSNKSNDIIVSKDIRDILSPSTIKEYSKISCEDFLGNYLVKNPSEDLKTKLMILVNDPKHKLNVFEELDSIVCECKLRSPNSFLEAYINVIQNNNRGKLYNSPRGLGLGLSNDERKWRNQFRDWKDGAGQMPLSSPDGLPTCSLKDKDD